jgi:Protein of unknown function (DUF3352)
MPAAGHARWHYGIREHVHHLPEGQTGMSFDNEGQQSVYSRYGVEDEALSSRGSRKWVGAAVAVAVVAALSLGGMTLLKVLGSGGAQPEDVFPNSAIVFAKLDLNPSAGQKLAAFQFASRFPKVKDKVTSEDTSIKESIFGSIFTGSKSWGLDYKLDVQPWLGDRIGVGVFPAMDGDNKPETAIAIAFTDENAAKAALDKAIAHANSKVQMVGYAFADGYVVVSDTAAHAQALVTEGKVSPLALPAWSTYGDDVRSLGSDQVGVVWVDVAASYKAILQGQLMNGPLGQLKGTSDPKNATGRFVMGLHVDPSYLELTGKGIDLRGASAPTTAGAANQAGLMASFPSDVFGAASATVLGHAGDRLFAGLIANGDPIGVKPMLSRLGIDSGKQVDALLGNEIGVVVGGTIDHPEYAVRTRGSDPDTALAVARKAVTAAQIPGLTVQKITDPDGILAGVGSGLTAAIVNGSGSKLGDNEAFRQVVPDLGAANFAAYVNLAKLVPLMAKDSPKDAESLKPFSALGLTAAGGAEPSFRLRLSVR